MPFYEVSMMDRKREFVEFASREWANVRELCRRFGISPTTGYKWLERYRSEGPAGLVERSRRPHLSPQRTASAIEARVLQVRDESNDVWGGRKIRQAMKRHGELDIPAASTITAILRRHDRLTEATAAQHPGPWQRFEREAPNELWQMDFKGHFAIHGGRCHPLTTLDDHSRF
ncbi:helix-turn-helix domain-containing protein, partial [Mesorhizobium sp.]